MRRTPAVLLRGLLVSVLVGEVLGSGAQAAPVPPHKGRDEALLWTELGGHEGREGRNGSGAAEKKASAGVPEFSRLARTLGPAVVNVATLQTDTRDPTSLFGHPRTRGLGTGFLINRAGYVVTNHHVVDRAEQIRVRLADDRELTAVLVGSDERTDIALLKIESPGDLPVAPLGDSDEIEIGEWVVAIGNPLGLDHTVTAGIVSGKGRTDVQPTAPTSSGITAGFYDFIQTDASINQGNSGGPLINARGEVIGINTAINAQAQGIAFAIPINMVKTVLPLLRDQGCVRRAWLGAGLQPLTSSLSRAFDLHDVRGALVSEVVKDSPAEQAGLEAGDLIVAFDGRPLRRADDLAWLVSTAGVARKIALTFRRGTASRTVAVTLVPDPLDPAPFSRPAPRAPHESPLGIEVAQMTPSLARQLGKPDLAGAVVMRVEPGSPASEAGVERGDVLLRVGDVLIRELEDYGKVVNALPRGSMIRLLARRNTQVLWLAFEKR